MKTSLIEERRSAGMEFTDEERQRYSRHLIMPEVTLAGQRQIKSGPRPVHWRGRTWFPRNALPGGGGRRHARPD